MVTFCCLCLTKYTKWIYWIDAEHMPLCRECLEMLVKEALLK